MQPYWQESLLASDVGVDRGCKHRQGYRCIDDGERGLVESSKCIVDWMAREKSETQRRAVGPRPAAGSFSVYAILARCSPELELKLVLTCLRCLSIAICQLVSNLLVLLHMLHLLCQTTLVNSYLLSRGIIIYSSRMLNRYRAREQDSLDGDGGQSLELVICW